MNQKTAKRLRRKALDLTVNLPERGYVQRGNQILNDPKTTRGVYLRLKQSASRRLSALAR